MPAPIALSPLAWTLLRYGAVAAVTLYATRGRPSQPKNAAHDQVLDDLPEGMDGHVHRAEGETGLHGQGRFRRTLHLGRGGPVIEIEGVTLGRLRMRRLD